MTAQIADRIIIGNKRYSLFSEPFHVFLITAYKGNPRPEWIHLLPTSTANWRGYQATWSIVDNQLFLNRITGTYQNERGTLKRLNLKLIFGSADPVMANWYSGTLKVPDGRLLKYVHAGYGSQYQKEHRIMVSKGVVQRIDWQE
jgi:hypothetical protein